MNANQKAEALRLASNLELGRGHAAEDAAPLRTLAAEPAPEPVAATKDELLQLVEKLQTRYRLSFLGSEQAMLDFARDWAFLTEPDARPAPEPVAWLQLPPLTEVMYHAVRGSEYEFSSGGPESVTGYFDDGMLDEIWENINTALRVAQVPKEEHHER